MSNRTMQFACLAVILMTFFVGFCGSSAFATMPGCDKASMQALAPTAPWPLTITSATDTAAASPTPEYCDVVGYVTTNGEGAGPGQAGFEIGIPAPGSWNGKYLFLGNGGLGTGLSQFPGASPQGLQKGYAVATTDMGHPSTSPFYGNWALLAPGVPNTPALIDFYYRATHQTALAGRQFVKAYYDKYNNGRGKISRSYYQGCSTGGRQGLVEAQRYPDDFDGLIAGDPVAGFAHQAPSQTGAEFGFLRPCAAGGLSASWIPPTLLPAIDAAVYAKCDPNHVGVIQNPPACSFDPKSLLCNTSNAGSCLTEDQVNGLTRYAGAFFDERGNVVMPGYPLTDLNRFDGGFPIMTSGLSQPSCDRNNPEPWLPGTPPGLPVHWGASDGTFPYFVFLTESYNQNQFPIEFFKNKGVIEEWALKLNDLRTNLGDATYPELMHRFVAGDGKMILYHGFSDPLITPYQTVQLYKDMATVTRGGYPRLQENVRLFMVPGMLHCGGGPGPNAFDMLTALENWVEDGIAPDAITATGGQTPKCSAMSMPLCKFPEVATYKGSGNICSATNWSCDPHNRDLLQLGYDGHLAGLPYSYLNDRGECHEDGH
ncbi:MAG TPA: tannase/feruloyl esterase family alpha/beta hydrolase [Syntrophorhabdales bacterium]|nr:tannase/feruloyl esterase family alpha/beta hydrolase [Syntrophorhabdales bacterium]